MRNAFTTFVVDEPFPHPMPGDLTVKITAVDSSGNIQIDVKNEDGQTLASDAQLSSFCISRICIENRPVKDGDVYYIRTVLIAKSDDKPTLQ